MDAFEELVRLAEIASKGKDREIGLYLRRLATRVRKENPLIAERIQRILHNNKPPSNLIRETSPDYDFIPRDQETRAELLRVEDNPQLDIEPVYGQQIEKQLERILAERRLHDQLIAQGLSPTRSILFTGLPGVGKTLTARWLARALGVPLASLDLATVMSSFLGRTGWNIRQALDYAKSNPCILLLDEFDALAKMRDDPTEVGELKRLVAVLLQEIDLWPSSSLLVAATNHERLLDPAVWRRFDIIIQFPLPDYDEIRKLLHGQITGPAINTSSSLIAACAYILRGNSYSDIQRIVRQMKMNAILDRNTLADQMERVIKGNATTLSSKDEQLAFASILRKSGFSERRINEITGMSRDTLRKYRDMGATNSQNRKG